jgi:hypothetical protein
MSIDQDYLRAGNSQTPCEELRKLFADTNVRVRRRVAENSNTPLDVLRTMSDDPDDEVRIAVASNPGCPSDVIEKIVNDESVFVRFELAEDPRLPEELLQRLAEDDNAYVKDQAQRTLAGIALEKALTEIGFEPVCGESEKLGEMLVQSKKLRAEQMEQFLRMSRDGKIPLGRVLAQTRALPRPVIVQALNLQMQVRRHQLCAVDAIKQLRIYQ